MKRPLDELCDLDFQEGEAYTFADGKGDGQGGNESGNGKGGEQCHEDVMMLYKYDVFSLRTYLP